MRLLVTNHVSRLNSEGVRLMDIVMIVIIFVLTVLCLLLYAFLPDGRADNFWQLGIMFASVLLGKFTNGFGKPLIKLGDKNGTS